MIVFDEIYWYSRGTRILSIIIKTHEDEVTAKSWSAQRLWSRSDQKIDFILNEGDGI